MSEGDPAGSSGTSSTEGSGRQQAERNHKTRPPCKFFLTRRGCSHGSECKFSHVIREKGAPGEEQRSRRSSKPPICRQFLTASGCRFWDRCRYRHVARELGGGGGGVEEILNQGVEQVSLEGAGGGGGREGEDSANLLDLTNFPGLGSAGNAGSVQPVPSSQPHPSPPHTSHPHKHHSFHTSKRHAPTELSLGSFMTTPTASAVAGGTRPHPPMERPQRTNKKTAAELRQAELEQLETRFHGNNRLVEKGKERSVYRVTFAPTDPDWNFKFTTVDLEVVFPKDYPTVPLSLNFPNDQGLHPIYITHGNQAVSRYLATAGGSGELMFRPFLRWFDRTITSVFKDAAKQVTAELFACSSGGDETTPTEDHTPSASEEESIESSGEEEDDEEGDNEQSDQGSDNQEELPAVVKADNKRGTEMRLSGLVMSDGVGVGRCASVKITLQCTRCRAQHDHSIKAECPTSELCSQCQSCYSFSYRPSIFHPTSSTLGFLDLQGCQPVDLILMQCEVTLTCLECGRDNTTSGLNYGEHRDTWCKRCHVKLSLSVEQCRFIQHQPGVLPAAASEGRKKRSERKKKKDALIQVGKPLPEFGTCVHYKKSNRWLRFPCCGKPFPCDVCHDETEDHVMERASRLICGFCSREQTYSSSRPCVGCGGDLVGGRPGAYWEGGKGCRNKVKMSRNDIHKYTNSADKTKCKKQERVGKQPTH